MDSDWMYQERIDGDVFNVITAVNGVLNSLLSGNLNVKFDISNQKNGLARGVIFCRQAGQDPPGASSREAPDAADPPTFAWNFYTWSTEDADDPAYDAIYKGFVNALNNGALPNGTQLGESQVKNSRAVFTNMHDGPATLSMFYPTT